MSPDSMPSEPGGVLAPMFNVRKQALRTSWLPRLQEGWGGPGAEWAPCACGAVPCSLPACRSWREPAGRPPKPPMLVGGLPGTASVSSVEAVPSGPAQTARGAGRGLPGCFSFRASPGCSPDIPAGTCRRQSRPGLGKPGSRQPVVRKHHGSLFLSTFYKLLNP